MTSAAPSAPTARVGIPRGRERTRAVIATEFAAAHGHDPWPSQVDRLELLLGWLRWALNHEGETVIRSFPQLWRTFGLPDAGGVKRDRASYRSSWARTLDAAEAMGWILPWAADYKDNGEGRGILLRPRRDSSVGRATTARRPPRRPGCSGPRRRPPRRPGCSGPRRRSFSSRELVPPLREKSPNHRYKAFHVVEEQQSRDTRARRCLRGSAQITGYVARHLSRASQESGSELVQAAPWLADVPVACLLRGAVLAFAPRPGSGWAKHWSVRLSESARLDAERHAAMLDHYDGRGAGAAAIIDLAAGGWRIHQPSGRPPRFPEPRTPGLLTRGLRKRARLSRDLARFRRDYAADGSS